MEFLKSQSDHRVPALDPYQLKTLKFITFTHKPFRDLFVPCGCLKNLDYLLIKRVERERQVIDWTMYKRDRLRNPIKSQGTKHRDLYISS